MSYVDTSYFDSQVSTAHRERAIWGLVLSRFRLRENWDAHSSRAQTRLVAERLGDSAGHLAGNPRVTSFNKATLRVTPGRSAYPENLRSPKGRLEVVVVRRRVAVWMVTRAVTASVRPRSLPAVMLSTSSIYFLDANLSEKCSFISDKFIGYIVL